MSEQPLDTLRCDPQDLRQAMSIHTRKITDACRDKDCIEDLRVYLTTGSQALLDSCANARVRCAELLYCYIDVEPVAFDHNHYCIDVTFYYRVLADAVVGVTRPATLYGLAVFSKRAVLCGEDSRAHIYTSDTRLGLPDGATRITANLPTAVVEAAAHKSKGRKPTENTTIRTTDHAMSKPISYRRLFFAEVMGSTHSCRIGIANICHIRVLVGTDWISMGSKRGSWMKFISDTKKECLRRRDLCEKAIDKIDKILYSRLYKMII